jgi:hypothetical protein
MKSTFFGTVVIATLVLVPLRFNEALAGTFTASSLGDVFSGAFSLNPQAPFETSYSNSSQTVFQSSTPFPLGTITSQIGANAFSSPIDSVVAVPGTDSAWRWYLNAFPLTLNGADVFGTMSIQLYGSTSSTSIIPLALTSYTLGTFQIQANTLDQTSGAVYFGTVSSLTYDASANFTFRGNITDRNLWSLNANGQAVAEPFVVPVPSPVVGAGLPGLVMAVAGFIGWRRSRRSIGGLNVIRRLVELGLKAKGK